MRQLSAAMFLAFNLSVVLLSGCSKDTPGTDPSAIPAHPLEDHSCDYKNTDGEGLQPYNSEIKTVMFGKTLDVGHLKAIAKASAQDTQKYINTNLGTNVYVTDTPVTGKCAFYNFLPAVPKDLGDFFAAQGDMKNGMFLAGLFMPRKSPGFPSVATSPAIIIMRGYDRWGLVHETVHDLFENEIIKANPSLGSRMNLTTLLQAHYTILEANTDHSSDSFFTELAQVEWDVYSIVLDFPLEEVANETLLTSYYKDGTLKYAPYSSVSSKKYIDSSLDKAQQILTSVTTELQKQRPTFNTQSTSAQSAESVQWSKLNELSNQILSEQAKRTYSGIAQTEESATTGIIDSRSKYHSTDISDIESDKVLDIITKFHHRSLNR